MKKMLSVVLMLVLVSTMVVGLAGCGKDKEVAPVEPPVVETPVVPVEEVEEIEEAVVVSLEDIVNTLKVTYGSDYLATQELEASVFNELVGIGDADYVEYYAAIAEEAVNVDTLFVVKTDEENKSVVKSAFEAYKEVLVSDPAQTPENIAILEQASILEYSDYVIFMVFTSAPVSETVDSTVTEPTDGVVNEPTDGAVNEPADGVVNEPAVENQVGAQQLGIDALDLLFEIGYNVDDTDLVVDTVTEGTVTEGTEDTTDVPAVEPTVEPAETVTPDVETEPTGNDFE